MSPVRQVLRARGTSAAAAALVAAGVLVSVGVAGAAQDETTVAEGEGSEGRWSQPSVSVQTGDTVTWSFPGTKTHNVASTNDSEKDPGWAPFAYKGEFEPVADDSSGSYTFYKSGTYTYVCRFHLGMTGEVVVTGEDLPFPTPTPTPTPTATPTVTATPTPSPTPQPGGGDDDGGGGGGGAAPDLPPPDDHTETPAPLPGADDTRPQLSGIAVSGLRRGARVRFRLSEPATVTIQFRRRGARRVLRTVRVQARAGTRTIRVRSAKLKRGRYTVQLRARDAMGNRSSLGRDSFRIRR